MGRGNRSANRSAASMPDADVREVDRANERRPFVTENARREMRRRRDLDHLTRQMTVGERMRGNQRDLLGRDAVDDLSATFGEHAWLQTVRKNRAEAQLVDRGTANRRDERIVQRDGLL